MKAKILLIVLFAIAIDGNKSFAQDMTTGKNEVRIGYGMLTGVEMANAVYSIWPTIGISGILRDTIADFSPSFYGVADMEYSRRLKPWISIGGSISLNPVNTYVRSKKGFEYTWTYYCFSVMPRVDFYYLNKGVFSMYSGIQVGASFIFWSDKTGNTSDNDFGVSPAFHINAFGIRVGKDIGGFVEWGYGFRGVVNFGLSAKF